MYKLYNRPLDRLKDSLGLSRKKLYKEHYALKDVSFDIGEGECVGIIGTNGSGKSTILKIITGVLAPTAGTVTVNGRISALLELGAGFNPEYSGMENIFLNGTMLGFSEEEINARLDEILSFADIGDFIHQPATKVVTVETPNQAPTVVAIASESKALPTFSTFPSSSTILAFEATPTTVPTVSKKSTNKNVHNTVIKLNAVSGLVM